MFILISAVIWLGNLTGLFQAAVGGLGPVMESLACRSSRPSSASTAATTRLAGLYDLHSKGLLSGNQLAVAGPSPITLTLSCRAWRSFLGHETEAQGWKATLLISAFICSVVAYSVGLATHGALTAVVGLWRSEFWRKFDEEAAARTCKGCAMLGGCGKVRCRSFQQHARRGW